MLPDDHILCCLFPNLCNLFNQPISVLILSAIFYGLNCIIGIYILVITVYKVLIIWKQCMKKIITNMVYQHNVKNANNKCEVKNTPLKVIDKCYKNKIKMDNVCNKNDNLVNNCNTNSKLCKQTISQKSLNCKNIFSRDKLVLETKNCTKDIDKEKKTEIPNLKKIPDNVATEFSNKNKFSNFYTQKINKDHFCITTYARNNSKMYTDKYIIPDNCWTQVKKIYKGCK